ncbi:hypothetical protein [Deinococcus multiflagellatus]|uniref:Uncharacterized protein n=1 Tax=Deinococcus multiflagellatus TaxID=1656887 RepID=A0ABW1ZR22_9DEIO|nr:hypothetical protein [Deinococcus multiflagellatus]MBZ9715780.1 hypothetical protein [Deinococcus multiflagellatus]
MSRTVLMTPDVTLSVKPILLDDQDLHLSLSGGPTSPFRLACRILGDAVQPLPLTRRSARGALQSARPGTDIQRALRQGADVVVFEGEYEAAAFRVRAAHLHVQPDKVGATQGLADQRSPALTRRLSQVLLCLLDTLLPPAGTRVTLSSGEALDLQHVQGGGLLADHTALVLTVAAGLEEQVQGGVDAHQAVHLAQALWQDLPFEGEDTDADDTGARILFDPACRTLRAELFGDGIDLRLTDADRLTVACAVLGALTSPAVSAGRLSSAAA